MNLNYFLMYLPLLSGCRSDLYEFMYRENSFKQLHFNTNYDTDIKFVSDKCIKKTCYDKINKKIKKFRYLIS